MANSDRDNSDKANSDWANSDIANSNRAFSRNILNRTGDNKHPCLTPNAVLNLFQYYYLAVRCF